MTPKKVGVISKNWKKHSSHFEHYCTAINNWTIEYPPWNCILSHLCGHNERGNLVEYTIIAFTSIIAIILTGAIFELYLHWSCNPNSLSDKDELNGPSLDALEGNERMHTWYIMLIQYKWKWEINLSNTQNHYHSMSILLIFRGNV